MRTWLLVVSALWGCKDGVEVVFSDGGERVRDAVVDAAPTDARPADAAPDATEPDGAAPDGAVPDAAAADGAVADGAVVDAAPLDGAVPADAAEAPADRGAVDAEPVDAAPPPGVDPGQPGPFEVVEADLDLPLEAPRQVRARVFRPRAAGAHPLVLFMHGFQLGGADYATTGRHLASHGLVVALPTMGDGLLNPLTHRQLALDVRRMLDTLADLPEVDADHIGAAGHSRGGKQVLLAALQDDRIRAVFGVDPVDSAPPLGGNPQDYPSVTPELIGELGIPAGFLGAGLAGMPAFPGAPACAPAADNYRAYYDAAPAPAWLYGLPQAGHLDFIDQCGVLCLTCVGGADPAAARAFAQQTLVAFFRWQLAGDAQMRPWVEGAPLRRFDGLVFEQKLDP